MIERRFDLDGFPVRVQSRDTALDCVIERLLGPYEAPASGESAIEITLDRSDQAPPVASGARVFAFPPLEGFATPAGWLLRDDIGWLTVDAAGGRIAGAVRTDAGLAELSRFAGLTVWVALLECLRARGRYALHAAALVDPAGETVLLAGKKGAGKSTATLALAERGFGVLTDDTVFVTESLEILGYAKRFHVRPDLLERRPELAPLARDPEPYEPQDKKWLALPAPPISIVRRAAAPTRIYFPTIVDADHSTTRALSPRETLLALLEHSCFVFARAELAPAHLAVLSTLADRAQGIQWRCGRDLLRAPARYVELAA